MFNGHPLRKEAPAKKLRETKFFALKKKFKQFWIKLMIESRWQSISQLQILLSFVFSGVDDDGVLVMIVMMMMMGFFKSCKQI